MEYRRNHCRDRRGFTLMEVMVVLAILVILGSIAVGVFTGVQATADRKAAQVQVQTIDQASELYRAVVGEYPATLDDLSIQPAHLTQTQWSGPHIEDIPLDPWGNPYEYVYPGQRNSHLQKPDIYSYGEDRQGGTEDDIGNWPAAE
jgi:general secretion pathway protein G